MENGQVKSFTHAKMEIKWLCRVIGWRNLARTAQIVEMLESNVDITERIRMQTKLEESAVLVEEYANQMEELANQRAAAVEGR